MRRRLRSFLTSAAAAVLAAACNALSGLDGDFLAAVPDASGATVDATAEASVPPDTSHADMDARPEAGPAATCVRAADAGVTTTTAFSCPTPLPENLRFCWDFNGQDSAPAYGWKRALASGGAPVVEEAAALGPMGKGLHAAVTASTGSASALTYDRLAPSEFTTGHALSLKYAFLVKSAGAAAVIGALGLNGADYGVALKPMGCAGRAGLVESDQSGREPALASDARALEIQLDRWYRATVTLKFENPGWSGVISVNDGAVTTVLATRPERAVPNGALAPSGAAYVVTVGAFDSVAGATSEVYVDDVTIERSVAP